MRIGGATGGDIGRRPELLYGIGQFTQENRIDVFAAIKWLVIVCIGKEIAARFKLEEQAMGIAQNGGDDKGQRNVDAVAVFEVKIIGESASPCLEIIGMEDDRYCCRGGGVSYARIANV